MMRQVRENPLEESRRVERLMMVRLIKDAILIAAGVGSATIGLKGFLLPNGFLDGGATGISLLTNQLTGVSVSVLIVLINLPFIVLGRVQISRSFAIKTSLAIVGLALAVKFVELPALTEDTLLIAVFGGVFLGGGIGLAIRGGSVIDGTEVMAVAISRRSTLTVGDVIAIFNVCLFSLAALLLGIDTALYSMLTYAAASKTADFIIQGIEEYTGITVVSDHADEIQDMIVNEIRRGVTVYRGVSGHGKKGRVDDDRKVIFTIVTRLEVQRVMVEIERIDPDAFVFHQTINDTKGGMIKRRPLH